VNRRAYEKQRGIVLLVVLGLLTLFGVVGLTFTYSTPEVQCQQNPTVELTDHGCTKVVGNSGR
jgi:ABC-type phosphate transport system auxiliary subunit